MEMKTIKCSVGENPLESFQRPVFFHDSSELRNYAAVLVLPRCQIVAIAAFFMISPRSRVERPESRRTTQQDISIQITRRTKCTGKSDTQVQNLEGVHRQRENA
ncbi:hypothetical protein T02_13142 [Trichinella nativa]|uniref:Uncharacterized protein n=1 Tax=Trichinella nativa TaxID=6335 RepID=A0A0V1LB47_9BILA|nr:hypothetical protein T02_13142 [Trichinella nativa]